MTLRDTKNFSNSIKLLSEINSHEFDSRIKFREEDHKYWIDNDDKDLISCTTFIHTFFQDFDTDKVINNILNSKNHKDPEYKYYNMSYNEIKNLWDTNKKQASDLGTELHADIEYYYNGIDVKNNSAEFCQFLNFYEDFKDLKMYRTEWMIFSDILKITGSIDAVFKNNDGTITLGDWKRSKEINFNSFDNKCGKFPFSHLPDCNFYHYSLQLNLYRMILEKFYNEKVKDMFLCIFHPNNKDNKYIKIPIERMDKEGELLFSFRIKQLQDLGYSKDLFTPLGISELESVKNIDCDDIEEDYTNKPMKRLLSRTDNGSKDGDKIQNSNLENKGKKWTQEEDNILMGNAKKGNSLETLSVYHKRSEISIKLRIMQNILKNTEDESELEKICKDFSQIDFKSLLDFKTQNSLKKNKKENKKEKETEVKVEKIKLDSSLNFLSEKQKYAYNCILEGKNILLTGPAGCGKTSCIKLFYSKYKNIKNIGMTSTTGISAILIGGSTIHSFLGIGLGKDSADILYMNILNNRKILKKWKELDILIIDEVSMLSPDLFDKLEYLARIIRKNTLPFGGIQLIISGDYCQLPCISSEKFCFESESWEKCINETIYLTEIFRQNDVEFQNCLNELRLGSMTQKTIDILKSRVNVKLKNENGIIPTKIYSLNRDVDEENDKELQKLFSKNNDIEFYQYELEYHVFKKNLKFTQEKIKKTCIAPQLLELCVGAQVMLLYNIDLESKLANGSRGVVIGFEDDLPIVKFLNGEQRIIEHREWKIEDNGETIMTISQIPLRLAFACTSHKTQGITLDYADVDLGGIFEYGQAYVALSRVKTLNGLSIRNLDIDKICAHPKAIEFYNNL
jgi:ATP-dependent DNA helicase PIF1